MGSSQTIRAGFKADRARDANALALTAGKFVRVAVGK